jgi:hypothetical protein
MRQMMSTGTGSNWSDAAGAVAAVASVAAAAPAEEELEELEEEEEEEEEEAVEAPMRALFLSGSMRSGGGDVEEGSGKSRRLRARG